MQLIFRIVYSLLVFTSRMTGFTYKEINIIVYYFIVPFVYAALLDKILKVHYIKISFAVIAFTALMLIKDFSGFSNWLFDRSVDFLLCFGTTEFSYIVSSVVICVFIPFGILGVLLYVAFKKKC